MSDDAITRVWDRIKADQEILHFTDAAIKFLKDLGKNLPEIADRPVFRVGVPEGKFWIGYKDEDKDSDIEVWESSDLVIIIEEEDYELIKGCTIDFQLMGLSSRLVLKHKLLKEPILSGSPIY